MTVVSYASYEEFQAYSPALGSSESEANIEAALLQASRDIDRFVGLLPRSATAEPPAKFDLTELSDDLAEGITNATLAQAEYRLVVGPEHFIHSAGTVVQGPDFTITHGSGASNRLGPKAIYELQAYGLILFGARARP